MAETFQQIGPGTNAVETIVKIESGGGLSRKSSEVLVVGDSGETLGLTIKWTTPKHLLIVLKDDPDLVYYQLVKTMGVEISFRNEYSRPK